jgi:hypothetical protein
MVVRAIHAVGNGEAIFGPSVARRILAFLTRPLSAYDEQAVPTAQRPLTVDARPHRGRSGQRRHSKSWHMCKDPDGEVALFRDQTLTHTAFPCVFLDVT